jgi:hypothetical protein
MVNTDMIVLVAVAAGAYFWLSSFSLADTVKGVGTAVAEGAVEVATTLVAEGEEFVASNLEVVGDAVEDQFEALECAVVDCRTEAEPMMESLDGYNMNDQGRFDFPTESATTQAVLSVRHQIMSALGAYNVTSEGFDFPAET